MKKLILVAVGIFTLFGVYTFGTNTRIQEDIQSFGATIFQVVQGGTGVATIPVSQLVYGRGTAPISTVATTSVSCSGSTTCTSFTAIGPSPITISSSGSGGSGTVSTSTNEIAGNLAYWTSNSGTPALLGQVATGTLSSANTALTVTANRYVVGGAATLTVSTTTTTMFTGTAGQVLAFTNTGWTGVATTTFGTGLTYTGATNSVVNSGVLSIGGTGQTLTGAVVLATSSVAFNGLTASTTITCATQTCTFANTLAGLLGLGGGGTGFSTYTKGDIIYSDNTNSLAKLGIGTGGFVLASVNGVPGWVATSSINNGVTALGGVGQQLTGSLLIATSSTAFNGLTASTTVTCATLTCTFTNTLAGLLGVGGGGTGLSTYTTGDLIYSSATNVLSKRGIGTGGFVLASVDGVPNWVATTTLSTITGTLAVVKGGTGLTTFGGTNTVLYTTAVDTLASEAAFTYNQSTNLLTADNASTTNLTVGTYFQSPLVVGGSAAGSSLEDRATIGNGVGAEFIKWTVGNNGAIEMARLLQSGLGIGTTTPRTNLTVSSSTKPQLTLTDASATSNPWNFRAINTSLYLATSSPSTFATSTGQSAVEVRDSGDPGLGLATSSPWRTLSVVGTVAINGLTTSTAGNSVCILSNFEVVTAGGTTCVTSSEKTKHDVADIDNADEIMKLRPVLYTNNEGKDQRYGFIAEEVNQIDPRLVQFAQQDIHFPDSTGVIKKGEPVSVDYERYVALLTKKVQEQQKQIDTLNNKVGITFGSIQDTVQDVKRTAEENWQDILIGILFCYVIYNEIDKRRKRS